MPTITLSMIVKNEENYLHDCLESVKGVVDEIVIVDTGSNDKTLEIAQEFNAKIFHFNWINDFSSARNFALSKSTGDWILYLDADERLEHKSKQELREKIKRNEKNGVKCIINNIDEYKNSPKLMKYTRLFRNDKKISFTGKAHEQIEPSLFKNGYKIINSLIEIIHLGYNVPEQKLKEKAERNLQLLLADHKENKTSYTAFQIANSYSILEDTEKSVNYFQEALKDKSLRREFKSVCYLHIADFEMRRGNFTNAKELIDRGLKIDSNHTLVNLIAAQIYNKLGDKLKALGYCDYAFRQNNQLKQYSNSNNVIDILVDSKKIIYEGISLSLDVKNNDSLVIYINELKNYSEEEHKSFSKILHNKEFNKGEVNLLISITNNKNLNTVLKLLKNNSEVEFKLDFFSKSYNKFNSNSFYLTNFGSFLADINQIEEAKIMFKTALDMDDIDYSAIFYLASIYAKSRQLKELSNLILLAEKKSENNILLFNKVNQLKERVSSLFS